MKRRSASPRKLAKRISKFSPGGTSKAGRKSGSSVADLQAQIERQARELSEARERQAAIAEVLRAIASSPRDLRPIFQAILDSAARVCRAEVGVFRLVEATGLRLAAHKVSPAMLKEFPPPAILEPNSFVARFISGKSPLHIPDLTAHRAYRAGEGYPVGLVKSGLRTALYVPMLRNDELIGVLSIGRRKIEPFGEKEIELVTDFAAEAAIALEITRRERQLREVQIELAHANRVATMGQLTASIAHELKQPVTAARFHASAALRWIDKTPPDLANVREALDGIVGATDRANSVVVHVGALARKEPLKHEVWDLKDAIMEVITLTHSEATKTGVRVRAQFAPSLPNIRADRVQLQQVVLNLIVNGIQAMDDVPDGQRDLLITSEGVEDGVRVKVRDTGPGLGPEKLERMFEPFYTTKPNGMGMGLSICRSIIEAHGGRLWATEHASQGAVFQFTLPTRPAGSADMSGPGTSPAGQNRRRRVTSRDRSAPFVIQGDAHEKSPINHTYPPPEMTRRGLPRLSFARDLTIGRGRLAGNRRFAGDPVRDGEASALRLLDEAGRLTPAHRGWLT